jgi:superfamily II DNA helicase RecQ
MLTKDVPPEALLLVQPTGSGKSAVPQTTSVVTNGVSIIIKPTLALSSDQASKFAMALKENGVIVHSYQLDLFKKDKDRRELSNKIISVLNKKNYKIYRWV